jgi:hypothetical protein
MQNQKWQCRVAPSLGALEGEHQDVWNTDEYMNDRSPTVFFGLYGLPDFYTLWRHKGQKAILWAGSDITHFQNGYHLTDSGDIRIHSEPLAQWINENCDNWVENKVEFNALLDMGIEAKVCPSFMGNIDDYEISYVHRERPEVYLSANSGREIEYGWGIVEEIADKCDVDFHLYGSDQWETAHNNVFVHGRIPKEEMNEQVKHMQCGLRLNEHMDGFSEITAKSVLWGQYPIVWRGYGYAGIDSFRVKDELIVKLNQLVGKTNPNPERDYYLDVINKYPWLSK